MDGHVLLATIRRPRGVRGEVVASAEGSPAERFVSGLKVVLATPDGVPHNPGSFTMERAWEQNGDLILQFRESTTRDDAEALRGMGVWLAESQRPPAPNGEFYLGDLVGCSVRTVAGETIGTVRAWHDFGATPLLELERPGGEEALLPFHSAFYREVNLSDRCIVMELPEGLLDLNR